MINIAIIGFGVVGSAVYDAVTKNNASISRYTNGNIINIKHIIDLRSFPGHPLSGIVTADYDSVLNDPELDVVIETMGGTDPAFDYTKRALTAKKHVVTSNKAVVERHGAELVETAKQNGVNYLFEASVGGGIPLISSLHHSFCANVIEKVSGILNGTTNFMLTKMKEENLSFDRALSLAQSLGYAEKDPTSDVDGLDAARKICILHALCFGYFAKMEDCAVIEGIRRVTAEHNKLAEKCGYSIKLLGVTTREAIYVAPHFVLTNSMIGAANGVLNAVSVVGDNVGEVVFSGRGAGGAPTASAVISDVVEAYKNTCPMLDYRGVAQLSVVLPDCDYFVISKDMKRIKDFFEVESVQEEAYICKAVGGVKYSDIIKDFCSDNDAAYRIL